MSVRVADKETGLTYERVRFLFKYNPWTGHLIRRVSRNTNSMKGQVIKCQPSRRYTVVTVDMRDYLAHRIIWLYMTGKWPTYQIDHINRIKYDNRWINLREATEHQQHVNIGINRRNKLGIRGITIVRNRFCVQLKIKGQCGYLGHFENLDDAIEVRKAAEIRYFGALCPTWAGYDVQEQWINNAEAQRKRTRQRL
jgi:hypothetical protein